MSTGDLEKSLREEIEARAAARASGLKEEVERLRAQFDEALSALAARADEAAQADPSLDVVISDHLRNARNLGIEAAASESTRARASSDIALIKAAVDDLESQHTQADILNALVNRAAAFAPRVAFFVVRNERATGWRARGLEGTVGDDSVREISLPVSSDTLLGEVARARSTWSGGPGSHAEDHTIYNHFGGEPPLRLVAVPMVARDKTVAVLYADSAGQDADAVNLEAIETLVRVAGMSVELLAARRTQPEAARQAAAAPQREAEAQTGAAEASAHAEEPARHEAVKAERADATPPQPQPQEAEPQGFGQPHAPSHAFDEPTPTPPQPAPSFSAQPEPQPSFASPAEVAPAAAAPATPVSPLGASRRYGAADVDFPVEVSEEDKRFHVEARRFARLLVSEIKLYNEQKVRDGRDAGDLYDRLRDDIDRSRQMYEKRVRPEVAGRYDYFHHELVNMLAEGDAAKLGSGYPGAAA